MLLSELAKKLGGIAKYEKDLDIIGVGNLKQANQNEIVYIAKKQSWKIIKHTRAGAVLVNNSLKIELDRPSIRVFDAKLAFVTCLNLFYPKHKWSPFISPKAFIEPTAKIAKGVTIMPNVVVMKDVVIEDGVVIYPGVIIETGAKISKYSVLYPNVVIGEHCIIGPSNIIYAGVVIGCDGFGYYDTKEERHKIPQVGIVRTGSRVEIGANTSIDRATIGETFVDDDTKIDNLCQIAHNCSIGKRCFISAQVGLAGSITIGNDVIMAGQVGLADHITIGDGVLILAQSGVPNDVKPGERIFGYPARPLRESHRINAALSKLPELVKRVSILEKKLEAKT